MICLGLGLGALGFFALRKACRSHHGCGGCHGCGRRHIHDHGWKRHWQRRGLHWLFRRIDASPAQERAIVAEVEQLRERVRAARVSAGDARGDVAAAIRGPELDDAALAPFLSRIDGSIAEVRAAAVTALHNIHALLDAGQRERVADLLDATWWRRASSAGGPYRV